MVGVPVLNNNGQIVVRSHIRSDDNTVTVDDNEILWLYDDGDVQVIARENDEAPGMAGARFSRFDSVAVNDDVTIVMEAGLHLELPQITNDNDRSLWQYHDGQWRVLIREGDYAVGIPGSTINNVEDYALNYAGQLVVLVRHKVYDGPDYVYTIERSFYSIDTETKKIKNLLFVGQEIDIDNAPGKEDNRTISSISFYGGANDRGEYGSGLNDSGVCDVVLGFRDGSAGRFLVSTVCLADVNRDGAVTPADFTSWIDAFNSASHGCDQNRDGDCTPTDFTAWIANFNAGC